MLIKLRKNRKAQAVFEYMILIVFVLGAFLFFQKYIARAFSGRWKTVGDSLGGGQIFDPKKTVECATFGAAPDDPRFPDEVVWYYVPCFEEHCTSLCYGDNAVAGDCLTCIKVTCKNDFCDGT